MEKTEVVIHRKLLSNVNLLIENTLMEEQKMKEDLDFFLSNNASQPKKKYVTKKINLYNTTRTKSRNVLTNSSCNRVKEEDLFDRSFVFNVYLLTIKNINPLSLKQNDF